MKERKPWWWPVPIDEEWFAILREDFPNEVGEDDKVLIDEYNDGWTEFSDTWDHLGDTRKQYAMLARAFLDLVEECGKSPSDFK